MEDIMNRKPFHCHPSIILEKAGGFVIAWLLILLSQADEFLPVLFSGKLNEITLETVLVLPVFLLLLPGLIAGYQFLVWKKTWISLDENTFIIERNTFTRKKKAYSISHIANINTEQNLFELLLHTCRIKIDLDNAADAESTDISIVLSCKKARELKTLLLSLRQNSHMRNPAEHLTETDNLQTYVSMREILVHCVCSLSGGFLFVSVLMLTCGIILLSGGTISLEEMLWEHKNADFSMKILAVSILIISYSYQIIRRLLTFYHFSVSRVEDELSIRYGFFRKQDYMIPVKNIHALRIVQAPIARLLHLYEAQLVCIGVGNGEEELAQLTLCCKKTALNKQLSEILPEFSTISTDALRRSPRKSWKMHSAAFLCQLCGFCLIPAGIIPYFFQDTAHFIPALCGGAALFLLLYRLLKFLCQGYCLGNSMVLFSNGSFSKTITYIPYRNIQRLCLKQNPLSSLLRLQRGSVYILASMLSREISFPYLKTEDVQKLTKNMMQSKI